MHPVRIGTRGSPLALAQAEEVKARLVAAHGLSPESVEIVVIAVSGDQIQDRALAEIGGKGLFTLEIEEGLAEGRIDLAVHSSKDMPTELPAGLYLSAFLPREDVRDAFLSEKAETLTDLPEGAVVGSASLRRQALIRLIRPDLRVVTFRGNVQTRLKKLAEGTVDATLLAMAGLNRLGLAHVARSALPLDLFPPAVGQGAICIESRTGDSRMDALLLPLNDPDTHAALTAERAFLKVLDGSCRTPIAGHARRQGETLVFDGLIARPDGSTAHRVQRTGPFDAPEALGLEAGEALKALAGPGFLEA
ncbi:MAG: hydroxymethylbilane synthase [Hyphomicrobiaceae bacterium]|nr:hydroxymethylbilane synthase [Hyphomicrobiaceae bacterium]